MERVTGIGGIFLQTESPEYLYDRYEKHLGIKREPHGQAPNMSAITNAVTIVVSESSLVRLFCHGKIVGEIIPELWMLDRTAQLKGLVKKGAIRRIDGVHADQRSRLSANRIDYSRVTSVDRLPRQRRSPHHRKHSEQEENSLCESPDCATPFLSLCLNSVQHFRS